jgi:hypothetical protein
MGILDFPTSIDQNGIWNGLPAAWRYPTAAPDAAALKKQEEADFMAGINQNPFEGYGNPDAPSLLAHTRHYFPDSAPPIIGTTSGQYGGTTTPFGLGGFNLPRPQGIPSSGPFPAISAESLASASARPQRVLQPPPPPLVPHVAGSGRMPPAVEFRSDDEKPDNTIPIGNYRMPAFAGNVGEPAGADRATPAFLRPPNSGGLGSAIRGAAANIQGGPLGIIGGAIAGALGMGQGNPQEVQRGNQKAQYDALIATGLTPQKAMLAILNPEAARVIVSQALSNSARSAQAKIATNPMAPAARTIDERQSTASRGYQTPTRASGTTSGGISWRVE